MHVLLVQDVVRLSGRLAALEARHSEVARAAEPHVRLPILTARRVLAFGGAFLCASGLFGGVVQVVERAHADTLVMTEELEELRSQLRAYHEASAAAHKPEGVVESTHSESKVEGVRGVAVQSCSLMAERASRLTMRVRLSTACSLSVTPMTREACIVRGRPHRRTACIV